MEDIVMQMLERKKTKLCFVGVKVAIKDGLNVTETYILFENSDDADKVFEVLSNHDAFDGDYNFVGKTNPNTIRVRGEIVVRYLQTNTLDITIYSSWEVL